MRIIRMAESVGMEEFPIASAFVARRLKDVVDAGSRGLLKRFPKMPKADADAIAAARTYRAYGTESAELESRKRDGGAVTALYDAIVMSGRSMGEELQDITGTRTLLADEGVTDAELEATYNPKGERDNLYWQHDHPKRPR